MLSSSAWQCLGEVNYRKWVIYDFHQPLPEFNDEDDPIQCAMAQCAGPIALHPISTADNVQASTQDTTRIVALSGQTLALFPAAKEQLAEGGLGWLGAHGSYSDEVLVFVDVGGEVWLRNCVGEEVSRFSLAEEIGGASIARVLFLQEGFVAVLGNGRVMKVGEIGIGNGGASKGDAKRTFWNEGNNVLVDMESGEGEDGVGMELGKTREAIEDGGEAGRSHWLAFAVSSKNVFISLANCAVVVVDEFSAIHYRPPNLTKPVVRMAVAPNDRFIACFTSDGVLIVYNISFSKRVLEFDTKTEMPPIAMQWCGDDSVVMYWKGLGLLMVGPYGDWVKYTYTDTLCILQEVDCLRILTKDKVEILQRVPATTDAICRIGSFAPSAMLVDAMEAVNAGDPKANDNIQAIREEDALASSVAQCIEAASGEFGIEQQKFLLQVAAFGKRFCLTTKEHYELGVKLAEACMQLRVLNVLRHESVGLPLTTAQLLRLTPVGVVRRLVVRNQHFLAKRFCEYLDLDLRTRRYVVEDWACNRLRRAMKELEISQEQSGVRALEAAGGGRSALGSLLSPREAELMRTLHKKLSSVRRSSFAKIGLLACRLEREELGVNLIQLESVVPRKILALIEVDQWTLGLQSALESNDANLMFLAVFQMYKARENAGELSKFFADMKVYPELYLQLLHYMSVSKPSLLRNAFLQLGRLSEAAQEQLKAGFEAKDVSIKLAKLGKARELYKNNKQFALQEELVSKELKLVQMQKELEELTGEDCFVGLSLVDTVHNCIILGLLSQADVVRSKLKLSDKQYYYVKVKALSQLQSWTELRNFASSRKAPIGYEYFAAACIERGNLAEAEFYLQLIKSDEERLNILMDLEKWAEASALVIKLEDISLAAALTSRCKDPAIIDALNAKFR